MRARVLIRLNQRPIRSGSLYPGHVFGIGRGPKQDLQLVGLGVSRAHATLELRRDGPYVSDLGSANGTILNSERLPANVPTPVPDRGVIEISDYLIQVLISTGDASRTNAEKERVQALVLDEQIEIRYLIATGAAGSVWAGWDEPHQHMVAVKVLQKLCDAEALERFGQEARVIARVDSPYVVKVFDFCATGVRPYLLMELVPGISAQDRLVEEPMALAEAVSVGADIAHALMALEEAAVVHRDVKPANVLLAPDGIAKLTDFGIAKDLNAGGEVTQKGDGLGSFCYMAPEQFCNAMDAEASADLYGLGATLYHLIGGHPPFVYSGRGNPALVIERIVNEAPEPLLKTAGGLPIPRELTALIQKLLEKEPSNRPSAREAFAELQALRALSAGEEDRSLDETQCD